MKKQFILLTAILLTNYLAAQAQFQPVTYTEKSNNAEANLAKSAIDLLIMAKFNESYPNVHDDAWAKTIKGYLVSFSLDGISHKIFLNRKGKMSSQIRYYTERNLPTVVADKIQKTFGCYNVSGVQEVTTNGRTAFLVTISNTNSWKVIQVAGDDVNVLEEHRFE